MHDRNTKGKNMDTNENKVADPNFSATTPITPPPEGSYTRSCKNIIAYWSDDRKWIRIEADCGKGDGTYRHSYVVYDIENYKGSLRIKRP